MPKFSEKKPRANYPQLGKTYEISLATGYAISQETSGKFLVHLKQGGVLELWESQLDQLILVTENTDKGTAKIIFEDVSTIQGKTKLMPKVVSEQL